MTGRLQLASLQILLGCSCSPTLTDEDWHVTSSRLLAVKSEPAEARPGVAVSYTMLVALPSGNSDARTPRWHFCTAPKPPTEDNSVSAACLGNEAMLDAGAGRNVTATTPANACSLFGPNAPPGGFRPRDPDITGGYFQPLRIDFPGEEAVFHLQRILCSLADASSDIAAMYGNTYKVNVNPQLSNLIAKANGKVVSDRHIAAGTELELITNWTQPSREIYAYFDRRSQSVVERVEDLRVTWFVTAGILARGTTAGPSECQFDAQSCTNRWALPNHAGTYKLWVVLRDSRGGVDFGEYEFVAD